MYNFAICLVQGKGVPADQEMALEYMQRAASLGDEGAIRLLEEIRVK